MVICMYGGVFCLVGKGKEEGIGDWHSVGAVRVGVGRPFCFSLS